MLCVVPPCTARRLLRLWGPPFFCLWFQRITWFLLWASSVSGGALGCSQGSALAPPTPGSVWCCAQILCHPLAGGSSGTDEDDDAYFSAVPASFIFPSPLDLSSWFLTSVNLVSRRYWISDLIRVNFCGCLSALVRSWYSCLYLPSPFPCDTVLCLVSPPPLSPLQTHKL